MNQRQVQALLVLRELGVDFRVETFAERLSVQKTVYIAQAPELASLHARVSLE